MNVLRNLSWMPALLLGSTLAQAHIASNGFLTVQVDRAQVSGALELAVRDGELAVGLDHDGDGKVTWGELRASQTALQTYGLGHLHLARRSRGPGLNRNGSQLTWPVTYSWVRGSSGDEKIWCVVPYSTI